MSIINKLTGFYGYTCDNNTSSSTDSKGEVNKCIIVLTYPLQPEDMNITISSGSSDWAVRMGDESIIPCTDPNVLYVNRDNSVIEFTMESYYPSNSPCSLVFRSDSATFELSTRWESRNFTENTASGHWAYTIDAYNSSKFTVKDYTGAADRYVGLVNKVLATFPFPYQQSEVEPTISSDDNHWAVRMGNGDIIPLKSPEIVSVNQDSFIVVFTMHDGYSYPSNAPGLMVYRSEDASISVTPIDDDDSFYNVTSLFDYPTTMISGETIDLNCVKVKPYNASRQNIVWSITSGNGELLNGHFLHAKSNGSVTVKATIANAVNDNSNFIFSFTVEITENVITIVKQPSHESILFTCDSPIPISVLAKSTNGEVNYQWYVNTVNSTSGATAISGATDSEYTPPVTSGVSHKYYFCQISCDGATSVNSSICHVYIKLAYTGIKIISKPDTNTMNMESTHQLSVEMVPSDALIPEVTWESSDSDIINIDANGKMTSNYLPGKVTITVRTKNGIIVEDSYTLSVNDIVPVTDIELSFNSINIGGQYQLDGTVVPSNATNATITNWEIVNKVNSTTKENTATTANAKITKTTSGYILSATTTGKIVVRATISRGTNLNADYVKEFYLESYDSKVISVTDIIMNTDTETAYSLDTILGLSWKIVPSNATNSTSTATLVSGNGKLINGNTLEFTGGGWVTVRITVKNGVYNESTKTYSNYVETFSFNCTGTNETRNLQDQFFPVEDIDLLFINDLGYDETNYWDIYNQNPVAIPYEVYPPAATNTTVTTTLLSITSKEMPTDIIYGYATSMDDDYWDNDWDNENASLISYNSSSGEISCDTSKFKPSRFYVLKVRAVVKNGLAEGSDFSKDLEIVIPTEIQKPFVPLDDFTMILPAKLRTFIPFLPLTANYDPDTVIGYKYDGIDDIDYQSSETCTDVNQLNDWSYTIDDDNANITFNSYNGSNRNPTVYGKYVIGGVTYNTNLKLTLIKAAATINSAIADDPSICKFAVDRVASKDMTMATIYHSYYSDFDIGGMTTYDIVEFDRATLYCFPYNPGTLGITINIEDAIYDTSVVKDPYNPTKTTFQKYVQYKILDPFIAVKDITINTDSIDMETKLLITPTLDTQGGMNYYNPCWDEDVPTNTEVKWSACIKNDSNSIDITTATGPYNSLMIDPSLFGTEINNIISAGGVLSLTAVIKEGTQEEYTWYGNTQDAIDYEKTFQLTINNSSSKTTTKLPVIKLNINSGDVIEITDQWQIEMLKAMSSDVEYEFNSTQKCKSTDITSIEFVDNSGKTNSLSITSLKDFGRGLTNLTKISGKIPSSVTGDNCFEGFLEGCTSLNCAIDFSNATAKGKYQFKNALRGCTSLNSKVTLPSSLTGEGCLYGFLTNCTSFNQSITIPSTVTGDSCLKFFMRDCSSFNQSISIPSGVSGYACLFGFMMDCFTFNKPLTLPTDLGKYVDDEGYLNGRQLCKFLEDCRNYCSTITITNEEGVKYSETSERSFSSFDWDSPMIQTGITFAGNGASRLCKYVSNNYELTDGEKPTPPWVHITNLD